MFLALFQGLKDDEPQFAFLRAIGSPPKHILRFVLIKGFIIAILAFFLALAFNLIAFYMIGNYLNPSYQVSSSAIIWSSYTAYTLLGLLSIVFMASILPAWHAYRINIIKTLANA